MNLKSLSVKDVTKDGELEAVVATLGVVDKDRDVTEKGFFGTQDTKIVSGHDWNQILLGKGVVTDEDGKEARFTGRLNLEDSDAAQLHAKLRFDLEVPPPLIEWSYGFSILDGGSRSGKFSGEDVRFLQPREDGTPGSKIYEVSPVLVGAGEGTRTVGVKSATELVTALLEAGLTPKQLSNLSDRFGFPWAADRLFDEDEGKTFAEQLSGTVVSVGAALDRASAIAKARAENTTGSRTLGTATLERLTELAVDLGLLWEKTQKIVESRPDEESDDDALRLLQAQFSAFAAR